MKSALKTAVEILGILLLIGAIAGAVYVDHRTMPDTKSAPAKKIERNS